MEPGKLDRRVQFLRATSTDDGFTQVQSFASHGSPVWAQRTPVSDAERQRAGEVAAHISCRFVVRYSAFTAGITPVDRMTCQGVEYDISGIKEIGRSEYLEITAAARAE